nr:G-type lectin S-receptor-like serine/threonine-protein kinase SD3-1 [Ipomoea batatas]
MLELEVHSSMTKFERTAISSVLLLWISIRFLFSSVSCSQIPLGSRLSSQDNSFWVSPNGYFEIRFLNYSCQYTFGTRFSSSFFPDNEHDAVVWIPGANSRVGSDSYLELTHNGALILFNSATGAIAWTSNTSNAGIESAVLRDDGNLVLLNQKNDVVWQSFNSPSDTLLPGQNLSVTKFLRGSSRSPDDSRYTLYMNVSGQLQLRWDSSVIYWTLGDPSQPAVQAILNNEGILQGHDQRSKVIWSVFGEDFSDRDVKFRFLKLGFDGNLRLYSWRNDSRSWKSVWQAFDNPCKVFATCGLHGICRFNSTGSHTCDCPFTSTGDSSSECLVPYQPNCSSGISMIRHDHMFLYGIYPPNETVVQTSLKHCQRLCEEDSLCYAVSFINDGVPQCRIKKSQYVSGWVDPLSSSISFVKTCSNPIAVLPTEEDNKADSSSEICTLCLIEVSMASVLAFVMIQLGIGLYIHRRRRYVGKKAGSLNLMPNASGSIMLSYLQIKELTGNFKNQIGPKMFKGVLPSNRLVVIKDLINTSIEERKFRNAVLRIGNIHHKNLLKLEAFCCESNYRFLVYEFAKNGSLDKCLGDPKICKRLTWRKRINICLSVARAVSYLHAGCREFINHGNLKCENVVLDNDLEAKVSEFGVRELLPEPSSNNEGPAETDVRDFGKMMLVLITGNQNANDACEWAYGKWAGAELETIADKQIEGGIDLGELERALRLSFWCLQADERMRPSMGEIVKVELEVKKWSDKELTGVYEQINTVVYDEGHVSIIGSSSVSWSLFHVLTPFFIVDFGYAVGKAASASPHEASQAFAIINLLFYLRAEDTQKGVCSEDVSHAVNTSPKSITSNGSRSRNGGTSVQIKFVKETEHYGPCNQPATAKDTSKSETNDPHAGNQ